MRDTALVVMAKQPQAGKTKTRLCPPYSPQQAADLFEALLCDTLALVASLDTIDLAVAISPPESAAYFTRIAPPHTRLLPITAPDIGACLTLALGALLQAGYRKVFALNADGPSLPRAYLEEAQASLAAADVVLGPGEDGGYYLVGLRQMHAALFESIPWSTGEVLKATCARAARLGLRTVLTPPWYDVDTPADAARIRAEALAAPAERLCHTRAFFLSLSDYA